MPRNQQPATGTAGIRGGEVGDNVMHHYEPIRELIDRVRGRWRALCALEALLRGTLVAARWTTGAPVVLMVMAAAALILAVGALTWCMAPLRRVPRDGKVARYIEERAPSLDDRL